jgi:Spy/CpxP family protein refolding chaperone
MARITRTTGTRVAAIAATMALVVLAGTLTAGAQMRGALRGKRALRAQAAAETTPLQVLSELLARLQLTDEQRQTIKGIISAHKDELLLVAGAEHTSRVALRAAIRQPALDSAGVAAAAGVVARADVQLSLQRAAIFSEVLAVLTETQRQELAAFAADVKAKILERLGNLGGAEADPGRLLAQAGNRLGLTDGQKTQIKEILLGHKAELAAIVTVEVAARTGLNAAIHQPAVAEIAVRRACVMVAAADLQLDLERARIFAEIWTVLTPEQQDQLTDMLAAIEARITARVEALLNIFKVLF